MTSPVFIKVEPATLQVRTTAMGSAPAAAHVLVIGQDDTHTPVKYHAACSCGAWSASHHSDPENIELLHAKHATKKELAANG